MEMTEEEKQAYNWALKQEFQSVAARDARILAKYIQRSEAAICTCTEDIRNGEIGSICRVHGST